MKLLAKHIIHLSIFLFLLGCEEEINWDIKPGERQVVVDAIITNEFKQQEINIYYSYPNLNDTTVPVSGAEVFIWDGDSVYEFRESATNPGLYLSQPFNAASLITYYLVYNVNGISDTAHAQMEAITNLNPYSFFQKDNGLYKYIYTGSYLPAMTEIYYDWSAFPEYCREYGACYASETYYTINVVDIVKEFAPDKQEILMPAGTKVVRRKYSLSKEHQEFVRSLLIETEWRGGLFDVEHGNIPSNFEGNTLGWFGVCQVLVDSTTVGGFQFSF